MDIVVGIILAVMGVLSMIFGIMILIHGANRHSTKWFCATMICIGLWDIGLAVFLMAKTLGIGDVMYVVQLYYIAALAIPPLMLLFVLSLTPHKMYAPVKIATLLPLLVLSIVILLYPGYIVSEIIDIGPSYTIELSVGYSVYVAVFIVYYVTSLVFLRLFGYRESNGLRGAQLNSVFGAYGLAGMIGGIFNLILPAMGNYSLIWIGPLATMLFIPLIYRSIVRQKLFDIGTAVTRTVAYVMTLAVLTAVYILLAYATSVIFFGGRVTEGIGLNPINIALSLLIAFMFQPVKFFFDQVTNKIFYRGTYSREIFVRDFGKIISYDTDLLLLLKQSSAYIRETLGAEGVFFYVNGRTVFAVNSKSKKRILPTDVDMIGAYYHKNYEFPAVLVSDLVESDQVRRVLKAYQIYMVLPLILQGQPIGYLFIGEHKSRGYTMRDVRVIESIANELAIAVQNSLSVEEIRELNENLQQRVESATKELRESNRQLQRLDEAKTEFISMASHQLRTPLTSIKGYLDMVLQGDLGKVSATQRTVLSEAFLSSERMVTLINDFLNVSRLQTGKFVIDRTEGDLKEVVADQVNMLQVIAKQHDLVIKETVDKDVPQMNIDIDKLRQVIVNFIDNAIYYSKPGTAIRVKLARDKHYVEFTVKDTGIGVPEAEKSKLFTRFFRAQNARRRRPDGTGVGLFLAKKVVMLHGGEIIFESEEGKGSTFGFRLPILSTETD